ncbi:hypothetical protein GSI_03326 [Ganoderma sinense ZZ0214-1]|uniref:Uncharacterized protein n=1 Tax=Ganoderma sinense ZZ0214-1 TaxID=1077348 RepID=A0A2G8SLU5_9APHY|nr:hypothetical protein GSI_03326 [Ganoderma sinense ZZ0214-1]
MSATLNHTASSLNYEAPGLTTMVDLRRTESLDTLPDIGSTTLSRDMRELSAWYRGQGSPNGHEPPQTFTPSNSSSSDEREVSPAPSGPREFVRHTSILSQASSLTSLESDAETESTLTSLESDCDTESTLTALDSDLRDGDSPMSPTSAHQTAPDSATISRTTSTSPSKPTRKRKRLYGCQPARQSKRLMAKRRKVAPS